MTKKILIEKVGASLLKIIILLLLLLLAIIVSDKASANTPVIDSANLAKAVEQVAAWTKQLEAMKHQLEQTKQQYAAITGSRGLGEILNNPTLRTSLPSEYKNIYEQVNNSSDYGITSLMQDIARAEAGDLEGKVEDIQKNIEARKIRSNIINKAVALKAYDGAVERLKQIEKLMKEINATKDLKAISELQARIAAEQAVISNDANKLMMISQLQKAERKLIDDQKSELSRRILSSKNIKMPSIK